MSMAFNAGVENRYLEGWDRFFLATSVVLAAAQGSIRVRNPAGSNVIAVLERATLQSNGLQTNSMQIGATNTDYGTALAGTAQDTRGRPLSSLVCTSTITVPVGLNTWYAMNSAAGSSQPLEAIPNEGTQVVILPGIAIQLVTQAAVTDTFRVCFGWRERSLEESERT